MLLLHHALFAPVCLGHTGDFVSWGWRDPHTLNLCPAVRFENWRTRRELHPQPSRRQRGALLIELRIQKWWEVLVTLQFVASGFVLRHPIYSRAAGSLPANGSGGRNHTCLKRFMRPSSVL